MKLLITILLFPLAASGQDFYTFNNGKSYKITIDSAIRTEYGTQYQYYFTKVDSIVEPGTLRFGGNTMYYFYSKQDMIDNGLPMFINLDSNFSSTSTTPSIVPGWNIQIDSGKIYRITVIGGYQTTALTTGGILGISTTGTGTVIGSASGAVTRSASTTELKIPITTLAGFIKTTKVSAVNLPHYIGLDLVFTCTGSGTFNIVWGSEVSGSQAQLNAGSTLIYQISN